MEQVIREIAVSHEHYLRLRKIFGLEDEMNSETALQNRIIVALNEQGCYAVNHTVGNFYTNRGGRVSIGVPGESDIWGHRPDGRAFYIEVKLPGETPRQNQLNFIEAMKNSGAIAGWCTSVDEALRIVGECNEKI